jgi:hypothetical protein
VAAGAASHGVHFPDVASSGSEDVGGRQEAQDGTSVAIEMSQTAAATLPGAQSVYAARAFAALPLPTAQSGLAAILSVLHPAATNMVLGLETPSVRPFSVALVAKPDPGFCCPLLQATGSGCLQMAPSMAWSCPSSHSTWPLTTYGTLWTFPRTSRWSPSRTSLMPRGASTCSRYAALSKYLDPSSGGGGLGSTTDRVQAFVLGFQASCLSLLASPPFSILQHKHRLREAGTAW